MGSFGTGVWDNDTALDTAFSLSMDLQEKISIAIAGKRENEAVVYLDVLVVFLEKAQCVSAIPSTDLVQKWMVLLLKQIHDNGWRDPYARARVVGKILMNLMSMAAANEAGLYDE